MLWKGRRESENVEDRRGVSRGGLAIGGGLGTVVILLVAMFLGVDPSAILNQTGEDTTVSTQPSRTASPGEDELKRF
ncbi:MAG TPA: neutral zinc metallopeptidase, partial [Blastocatellia bacterium]|nr:neutral zinc metallopeptidase [Blastocatellia bacterium]